VLVLIQSVASWSGYCKVWTHIQPVGVEHNKALGTDATLNPSLQPCHSAQDQVATAFHNQACLLMTCIRQQHVHNPEQMIFHRKFKARAPQRKAPCHHDLWHMSHTKVTSSNEIFVQSTRNCLRSSLARTYTCSPCAARLRPPSVASALTEHTAHTHSTPVCSSLAFAPYL